MKKYNRKQFLKLGGLAGAGFFLAACGVDIKDNRPKETKPKTNALNESEPPRKENKLPELITKEDSRYEVLRKGFNKRIDKFPLVIALCTSTEEVSSAIMYAKEKGLEVAIKSGGHSMEGFSSNNGGMVINLSKLNTIELRKDNTVKTGPGCTLVQVYDTLLPQERIIPAGSCATVGLGGLTLGGGYGLFSRQYGLTCDHLLEATVVDGMGNIHFTKKDPELLWALKGGGSGNFGVVTQLIYRTHAAPANMQAHYFKASNLDAGRAVDLLKVWMDFAVKLPLTCFSGFVLNRSTLNIVVTNYGEHSSGLQQLLSSLAKSTDTFKSTRFRKLSKMLRNHYGSLSPVHFRNSSAGLFKNFEEIGLIANQIFEKVISTPGMIYQVNTLGGKIADAELEKASCFPHRACDFVSELQAYSTNPSQDAGLEKVTSEILQLVSSNGIKAQYFNYCSLEFENPGAAYYGENYTRLQAIKAKYDSGNLIRHPQSVRV